MPANNFTANKQLLYAGIDEVLAKPPSRIVQYGSAILLFIIVLLFCIAFFVRYNDGVNERVILQSVNSKMILSGNEQTTVKRIPEQNIDMVKKGDTLIILTDAANNNIVLTAPLDGKLHKQRILVDGDNLNSSTPLFLIENGSADYRVSIAIEQKDVRSIAIGQTVKITLDKFPREKYRQLTARITSLPYESEKAGSYVADAELVDHLFFLDKKMPLIYQEPGSAFIITGHKRLFARFLNF